MIKLVDIIKCRCGKCDNLKEATLYEKMEGIRYVCIAHNKGGLISFVAITNENFASKCDEFEPKCFMFR